MKKVIVIIVYIFSYSLVNAQQTISHEQITREGDFTLSFPDTLSTETLHVKCVYDDKKVDDIYSIYLGNGEKAEPNFVMNKQLNFDVFVDKFTTQCKSILETKLSPDIFSLYQVYYLIWRIKNPLGDAPEAGILQFSRGILIFNAPANKEVYPPEYFVRRNRIDSINNKIINAESNAKGTKEDLEDKFIKDTLEINQKIDFFNKAMNEKQWLDQEVFVPYIHALDSLVCKYIFEPHFMDSVSTFEVKLRHLNYPATMTDSQNQNFHHLLNYIILEATRVLRGNKVIITNALHKKSYAETFKIYSPEDAVKISTLIKKNKDNNTAIKPVLDSSQKQFSLHNIKKGTDLVFQYAKINKIEMQFEKGFIEAIKVWITIGSSEFIFENIYAIGFSSVNNYKNLAYTKLFIRNSSKDSYNYYIYVSDIFRNYDNQLNNYTRDYSPADTSFIINPAEYPEITLRKEKYVNLIDAKLYGDLTGIDKTKPNGLLQIEVSKRFNINTSRIQPGGNRSDFGYLNYIDLFGSLSKIEQNNKQLILHNAGIINNGNIISPNYATNLDFLRYENYTAGINVGLMLFDMPDNKFTAYLDFGIKYGHTVISDSVFLASSNSLLKKFDNPLEAHTLTFQFPKISIELFPESRITPKISWQLNSTKLFSNNQFKQVVSYDKSDITNFLLEKRAKLSNQYEMFVKIAPNKDYSSNIFLRFRFFTQFSDANTSFSQFQIGYAYNWTLNK